MARWRTVAWVGCVAAALVGCRRPSSAPQTQPATARIVSFSPAITQILFDVGLGEQVVGVTRFCQLPAGQQRPRVGDALAVSAEAILAARPDVILAQTRPGKFQGVRDLAPHVRVVQLRLEELADVPAAIKRIGRIVGRPKLAARHQASFMAEIDAVRRRVAGRERPRVLFVMGTDRPVAAGPGNFIHDLIEAAGGANAGADIAGAAAWRPTHVEAILKVAPDVLVCQTSAEKADAARRYWLGWKDLPAAAKRRVYVATDPKWAWPSTRLAALAPKLAAMIHPELLDSGASAPAARPGKATSPGTRPAERPPGGSGER